MVLDPRLSGVQERGTRSFQLQCARVWYFILASPVCSSVVPDPRRSGVLKRGTASSPVWCVRDWYWSSPHLCDLAAKVLKFLEENDLWAKVEFFCLEYVDHGDSRLDLMIVVRNLAMLIDVLLDKKSIFPRCWWPEAFVLGSILMNLPLIRLMST